VMIGQVWAVRCWSGGCDDDDGVAEGFELADVIACLAAGIDAAGVVGGVQVAVAQGGVG